VYLDAAAGVPLHPAARQVLMNSYDEGWADPVKIYAAGRRARMLLDAARQTVADCLGARPDEVFFTSSGTQAAHLGVLGTLAGGRRRGRHLVVSAVEHSSVLHAADMHSRDGGEVATVGVSRLGGVEVDAFAAALRPDTALACLQWGNHEVGTLQPVEEVANRCQAAGVPLYVDAAAGVGQLSPPRGWSLLSASAHKWGGPPGVGVLITRKGVRWRSPLPADEREGGRVPGSPALPAIVAAAAALQARVNEMTQESQRLFALVDRIRTRVPEILPDVMVVGDPVHRLPHIVTFSCLYVAGEALLIELDKAGFAVSSGSSCTSSTLTPSHVLEAMGVLTSGNVRVSLWWGTTEADVERFLAVLPAVVERLRIEAGASNL
jgi:cysteine desulfurase